MAKETTYRATFALKLRYQTAFSFTPDGVTNMAHHRYIIPGKDAKKGYAMLLQFFCGKTKRLKCVRYHLENARARVLYLRDLVSPNTCAKQNEIDVIQVNQYGKIIN